MGKCLFMRKGETHTEPRQGLPSGYTELEYIQSSGTQHIDTGFVPNQDTRVVMDFDAVSIPNGKTATLFSARGNGTNGGWSVNAFAVFAQSSFTTLVDQYASAYVTPSVSSSGRHTVDKNKNVTFFDGNEIQRFTYTAFTSAVQLRLLYDNQPSGGDEHPFGGKLYSCQIYDNGNLVRDFIPCINPSGAVGLYDKVTKAFFGNAGTGTFGCNLDFENQTWEQIITACQTNTVPSIWQVGDQKAMTINGTDYLIDIIGKNHDDYAHGSGKAPLTFQLHDVFDSWQMNPSNQNNSGWVNCAMRKTHLPEVMTKLPTEVQTGIKEVNKLGSAGGGSSTISTIADKLFLLSEVEIFGTASNSFSGEGTQYDYYKAGNSKEKYYNGSNQTWWTRSPHTGTKYWVGVKNDGSNSFYYGAVGSNYVSFAFCF